MKWLANKIMSRRANRLLERIGRYLPQSGKVADIGSGTGHNAEAIRQQTQLFVSQFDVADLHWVGSAPHIFSASDGRIPVSDGFFDSVMLLYVLHYPYRPQELLTEACRVSSGPVIVLQSTYSGYRAGAVLRFREFFFGRFGFYVARLSGLVSARECPLEPAHFFTREALRELFQAAGLEISVQVSEASSLGNLRRELFILNQADQRKDRQS